MLTVLFFLWLFLVPFPAVAQDDTPTPTITEAVIPTETPTPSPTVTPTPAPSSTPTAAPVTSNSTSTSTPTSTPTPKVVPKQTTTSQQGNFGGQGLVDEKDEVDTGLGFDKDNVQGTTTVKEENTAGDKDLLITLIFLTGAVILVVWTIYMILIQKGIIKSGVKKEKSHGGITPQPLQ